MAGRRPKPTRLKVITGNPGKRKLPENEPQPEPIGKEPPVWLALTQAGRAEWEPIAAILSPIGLLTRADAHALAALCEAIARYRTAQRTLDQSGMVIRSPKGYPIQNPYLAIVNKAHEQMVKLLTEFGMTPAARSRTSAAGDGEDADEGDPWQKLGS